MLLDWLFDRFRRYAEAEAIVWRDETYSYGQLLDRVGSAVRFLEDQRLDAGASIMLNGDYSPAAIALLLAAAARGIVLVPVASHVVADRAKLAEIAQCSARVDVKDGLTYRLTRLPHRMDHPLLVQLTASLRPGLVLFSSGSTGKPKAVLHDLAALLSRFRSRTAHPTHHYLSPV